MSIHASATGAVILLSRPLHAGIKISKSGWRSFLYIPCGDIYPVAMRIIAKRTLRAYWESESRAEQPLKAWYAIAAKADWSSPADVKAVYGNASIVGNDRVVFNIGGYKYRLIVRFNYVHRIGFVRFVGTHSEYDAVDASNV